MKQEVLLGHCVRCATSIRDSDTGWDVVDGLLCNACYRIHVSRLVDDLEAFRASNAFVSREAVLRKKLWLSEQMGFWHDNPIDNLMERIDDYAEDDLIELHLLLLDELITLMREVDRDPSPIRKQVRDIRAFRREQQSNYI